MKAHQGDITVESQLGKGSCFKVTLKKGDAHFDSSVSRIEPEQDKEYIYYSEDKELLVKEVQTAQSESGTTDCKLLVIDDNEEIRNILVDIFSPLYTVETASDVRIGADIYVVKPFNMRRLVMQCNNLINTRRLLQNKYAHQLDSKAEKIATNELDQRFIEQATQVVEDNMENPEFSVDVFSREMGVGRTVLFQKIKGITGSTPNNFIMNLRLKKAAYFLQNSPEMNISDIAYRLGFGNPQYFNKCFKELFDIAPTQYRKAHNTSSEPSVK